jgi:hypothetical protein
VDAAGERVAGMGDEEAAAEVAEEGDGRADVAGDGVSPGEGDGAGEHVGGAGRPGYGPQQTPTQSVGAAAPAGQ